MGWRGAALVAGCVVAAGVAAAAEVRVYNWTDYIDPAVLAEFERESGHRVIYDTYDSNEVLEAKLLAGKTGYDVVVPTSYFLHRQIAVGVLAPLQKDLLPNLTHMDTGLMARLAAHDPGNAHGIIYLWGTTGIGVNVARVAKAAPGAPIDSLALLFDPALVAKVASCGVSLLDAPDDVVPAVLHYLGRDPRAKDAQSLAAAEAHLMRIRPHVRRFHSSQYINDLARGEICVAFGWSGDILQAKARGAEGKKKIEIAYRVPKEGAMMWFDVLAIPKDAPNLAGAHALLDFLMRPDVIARISNTVQYPNANRASWPLVDAAARSDPDVWPSPAVIDRLYTVAPSNAAEQRLFTRLWTRVKAGR